MWTYFVGRKAGLLVAIIYLLLFLSPFERVYSESEYAENVLGGVLDLREHKFHEEPIITLSGSWNYISGKILEPQEIKLLGFGNSVTSLLRFPFQWQETGMKEKGKPVGKLTAYMRLYLAGKGDVSPLMMRIPPSDSAYNVFVNGSLFLSNGKVGEDASRSYIESYVPLQKSLPHESIIDIVIQASSFHHPRGGFRDPILIGTENEIVNFVNRNLAVELFLTGVLLLIGIHHLAVYHLWNNSKFLLAFGFLSIDVAFRLLITGEGFFYNIAGIDWSTGTFLEYLTYYLAIPTFVFYIRELYPSNFSNQVFYTFNIIAALFIATLFIAPILVYADLLLGFHVFTFIAGLYTVYIILYALIQKKEGALTILSGFAILFITLIHDMLFNYRFYGTGYLTPFGLLTFFFSQSYIISRRFSYSFRRVEELNIELEQKVRERTKEIEEARERELEERRVCNNLLLNILPEPIAVELLKKGEVEPRAYPAVTILFADFVNFSRWATVRPSKEVVIELNILFLQFDQICEKRGIEKLKTIGDGYMAAGGIPDESPTHAIDVALAANDMRYFVNEMKMMKKSLTGEEYPDIRVGIHSGPITAGVIGQKRFTYDIWGDTVNLASRTETNSISGCINVTEDTYRYIKEFFVFESRGEISVKNMGSKKMYFLESIKADLSQEGIGIQPGSQFEKLSRKKFGKEPGNNGKDIIGSESLDNRLAMWNLNRSSIGSRE